MAAGWRARRACAFINWMTAGTDHQVEILWLKHPVFSAAGEAVCVELARRYPASSEAAEVPLFRAGELAENMVVLLDGAARLFHEVSDGRQVTIKLLKAPNTAGTLEVLHGVRRLTNATTIEPSLIARVPRAELLAFLESYPPACLAMLRHTAAAFLVSARNEQQAFASLAARVANLLLSYSQYYGVREPAGVRIEYPLSQQVIADGVGAVRRSVAGLMAEWRAENVLTKRRGKIVLLDPVRLAQCAGIVHDSICYRMGMPLDHLPGTPALPSARLEVVSGRGSMSGRETRLGSQLLIGRAAPCELILADELVSPQHCRVFRAATGGRYWIEDLESENGTLVNGKKVQRAVLKPGDVIQLGATKLVLKLGDEEDHNVK